MQQLRIMHNQFNIRSCCAQQHHRFQRCNVAHLNIHFFSLDLRDDSKKIERKEINDTKIYWFIGWERVKRIGWECEFSQAKMNSWVIYLFCIQTASDWDTNRLAKFTKNTWEFVVARMQNMQIYADQNIPRTRTRRFRTNSQSNASLDNWMIACVTKFRQIPKKTSHLRNMQNKIESSRSIRSTDTNSDSEMHQKIKCKVNAATRKKIGFV